MLQFVYPYSFVPLPAAVSRTRPTGHHRAAGNTLTGHLDVTFTATCPISTTAESDPDSSAAHKVRGSAIRGALRSLHEAMNGSCLRVVDLDFVPSYREAATLRPRSLAVVTRVEHDENGYVTELDLDAPGPDFTTRISVKTIRQSGIPAKEIRTGARLQFPATPDLETIGEGDKEMTAYVAHQVAADPDGKQVLLVSRTALKRSWYYAVESPAGFDGASVSSAVLAQFNRALAGSDDVRPNRPQDGQLTLNGWTFETVPSAGYRLLPKMQDSQLVEALRVGQPVWVELENDDVTWVGLSQIWRHPGEHSVGDRLGKGAGTRPCHDPADLCPSCAIFGAIDARAADEDAHAQQRSYASHVYSNDAEFPDRSPRVIELTLPRTDAPRPGAGQFTLEDTGVEATAPDVKTQLPGRNDRHPYAREWGSKRDKTPSGPRRIRGRKAYWTSTWQPDHVRRNAAGEPNPGRRVALDVGAQFTVRLTFQSLTRSQLGGLIAAAEPSAWARLWNDRPADAIPENMRFRLGGGKNFGLGAARTAVHLTLEDPTSRWTGATTDETATSESPDTLVPEFIEEVSVAVREQVWPALAHLLTEDFVDPELIDFPKKPGGTDPDFEFYKNSGGQIRSQEISPLVVLPDAAQSGRRQVMDTRSARPSTRKQSNHNGGR